MGQAVKNEKKAVCFHKNLDTILEKIYVEIQGDKRGNIYKYGLLMEAGDNAFLTFFQPLHLIQRVH